MTWVWIRRKPKTFPNVQSKGWETRRKRMALDFQDNVDPPDPMITPDRMDEIRELARCVEFVDERNALREMRWAVVDLLNIIEAVNRDLDEMFARHRALSERHWTCNRCGGSWNCEPLAERDDHGCRVPSQPCPYCRLGTRK